MAYKAVPLDVISAPNFYSPLSGGRWELTGDNAVTIWFQLMIEDSLGSRRYIAASGSGMQLVFKRSDLVSLGNLNKLTQTPRNVTKTATKNSNDASLYSCNLAQSDVQGIVSGAIQFTLTEGSTVTTWLQDFAVRKTLTSAGF
jgi:hypothetical protein